jgi:hypothetical protein
MGNLPVGSRVGFAYAGGDFDVLCDMASVVRDQLS